MQYATSEFISIKSIIIICVSIILLLTGCINSGSDADYEKALEEPAAEKDSVEQDASQEKLPKEDLPVIEEQVTEKDESKETEPTNIAIEITPDKEEYAVGDKPLLK